MGQRFFKIHTHDHRIVIYWANKANGDITTLTAPQDMRGKIIAEYNNIIHPAFFRWLSKYPPMAAKACHRKARV